MCLKEISQTRSQLDFLRNMDNVKYDNGSAALGDIQRLFTKQSLIQPLGALSRQGYGKLLRSFFRLT